MEGLKNNLEIQCSLKWNASYNMHLQIIYIKKMVKHLLGFKVLTRVINKYANDQNC